MTGLRFRAARSDDTERVAALHADSWRRHYRGAYADAYLDGDIHADRLAVWSARLAAPAHALTVLAEDDGGLVGFVHVIFDNDRRWGSLVDNLHVGHQRQRSGVGRALMAHAAAGVVERAASTSMYLWVLEQNLRAQRFYRALGGSHVEVAAVPPPGGVPTRLNGAPNGLRMVWPDAASLAALVG